MHRKKAVEDEEGKKRGRKRGQGWERCGDSKGDRQTDRARECGNLGKAAGGGSLLAVQQSPSS